MGYLTHGAEAGGKIYGLLPCPHCGGEAEFRDGSSTVPYIRCKSCGCRTGSGRSYEKLVERWNRRAERTCHVERVSTPYHAGPPRCSACMMPMEPLVNYCSYCGARVVGE